MRRKKWRAPKHYPSAEVTAWVKEVCGVTIKPPGEILFGENAIFYRWPKARWWGSARYPACEVRPCDLCGIVRPKKLTYPQGFSTGDFENYFGGDFCIGCLGRVTAISRKADEWREIKALIRKLDEARLTLDRGLVDHLRLPQLRKAATPPD